jgi:penicillin amidase
MLGVDPKSERARAAVERLAGWDGHMDRDKVEPLLFTAWLRALNRAILADELGDLFQSYWDLRPLVMRDILTRDQSWCDDRTTPEVETCEDALAASLETALGELATAYGERMDDWSWGRAHPAVFTNQVLTQVPILRDFASPEIPSSGGYDTVNRGATSIRSARPYANVHGSGLRMIVDLAAPGEARWMIVPGQSGNILSPHYADLVRPWRDFASLTLPGAPVATLVLAPQ